MSELTFADFKKMCEVNKMHCPTCPIRRKWKGLDYCYFMTAKPYEWDFDFLNEIIRKNLEKVGSGEK